MSVDLHLLLFELRVYGKMDWGRTLALVESVDQGAVLVDYYSTAVPPYCVHCRVYLAIAVERGDNWTSFPVFLKARDMKNMKDRFHYQLIRYKDENSEI